MATISAAWTEAISIQTLEAINPSAAKSDDFDIAAAGYDTVKLQFTVAFSAAAVNDYKVEILTSADSGSTDDSVATYTLLIPAPGSGGHVIDSITIPNEPFIRIKRTNLDTTETATETILAAGRKWSSA